MTDEQPSQLPPGIDLDDVLRKAREKMTELSDKNLITRFIVKPTTYHDVDGRTIIENEVVSGVPPKDFVRFVAQGVIKLRGRAPDGAVRDLEVPINAAMPTNVTSLERAFVLFDAMIEKAGKEHVEQMKADHAKARLTQGISR